jgi:hypothetical protein
MGEHPAYISTRNKRAQDFGKERLGNSGCGTKGDGAPSLVYSPKDLGRIYETTTRFTLWLAGIVLSKCNLSIAIISTESGPLPAFHA